MSRTEPKLQKITVLMGEGKVVADHEGLIGEFHRWEPSVIVVKKGDTIELTVINPRKSAHSLVIPELGVDTGLIPGRLDEPDQSKRTVTLTFKVEQSGVFEFRCGTPFDPDENECSPDHPYQVGYIIVLE
jgi:heme/copper-type cytochrome/quinol oxidase subunit 2